jgi:hypothetical protein
MKSATCLPLVGPGQSVSVRGPKTNALRRKKPTKSEATTRLPLVGPAQSNQLQKGDLAADASLPPPGSFFDEKMLSSVWGRIFILQPIYNRPSSLRRATLDHIQASRLLPRAAACRASVRRSSQKFG